MKKKHKTLDLGQAEAGRLRASRRDGGATQPELVAGKDYYLEGSKMVFTADFLRRRGYCCESGCRHCPYGFGPEGLKKRLAEEQSAKNRT